MVWRRLVSAFVAACVAPETAAAAENMVCEKAALKAEKSFGLPDGLLQAIAIVESGRFIDNKKNAWPWTVNVAGKGHYFSSRLEAEKFVALKSAANVESVDIGCFQINKKWHGNAFSSEQAMFDANRGAEYAASFLNALKEETGDWETAIQYYHSRTDRLGKSYSLRVYDTIDEIRKKSANLKGPRSTVANTNLNQNLGGVHLSFFKKFRPLIDSKKVRSVTREEE